MRCIVWRGRGGGELRDRDKRGTLWEPGIRFSRASNSSSSPDCWGMFQTEWLERGWCYSKWLRKWLWFHGDGTVAPYFLCCFDALFRAGLPLFGRTRLNRQNAACLCIVQRESKQPLGTSDGHCGVTQVPESEDERAELMIMRSTLTDAHCGQALLEVLHAI